MSMKSVRLFASATLLMVALPLTVQAFQPLVTDDTGTQGAGGNQVELSVNLDRVRVDGETERVRTVPFVFTRGLSDTFDVFAGFSHSRIKPDSSSATVNGNANPTVGAKWRFYESESTGSTLAIKPELILPISRPREDSGLGSGRLSGNLTFILSQEVPFGAVHVNVGVGKERYRDTQTNPNATIRRASIAPVWDVSDQWKLAADLGVESSRAAGATTRSRFAELGAIYSPDKDVDLAFGVIRSSDNATPKSVTHTLTAGVTWRFM